MCNPAGRNYGIINPTGKLLGRKFEVADPLMYNFEQSVKTPDIPTPTAPQDLKRPDTYRKTTRKGVGGATLLTGGSGLGAGSLNTGGTTLLGE